MADVTNRSHLHGTLAEALAGADVFIGVSAPEMCDPGDGAHHGTRPHRVPHGQSRAGDHARRRPWRPARAVVGTGRSDFPNQINNVLAFPGIFRGALDVRARDINEEMKMAASRAIASLVSDEELTPRYILPEAFDRRVGPAVARAVAEAAVRSGVARLPLPDAQA